MENNRTLRRNIRTTPQISIKEMFEKEIRRGKKQQIEPQITFNEFLDGAKKVTEAGIQIMSIVENIANIKDQLEAETIYDNLSIKKFGVGGAHITLPSEFIGMKAKVIIKHKNNHKK